MSTEDEGYVDPAIGLSAKELLDVLKESAEEVFLTMVGLATDFCVSFSAIDAAKLGHKVTLRQDLCRAIDLDGSLAVAQAGMLAAGVKLI